MNFSIFRLSDFLIVGAALLVFAGCATDDRRTQTPAAPQTVAKVAEKPLTPDQQAEKIRLEARGLRNGYKLKAGHEEKLREAMSVKDITDKERQQIVSDLVHDVFMNENATAYAKAQALIEPILAEPTMTNNAARIAYTIALSDAAFRSNQPDEAKRLIDELWKLPNIQWYDVNAIFNARVAIDKKMCDYASARTTYRKVFENPEEGVHRRWDCLKASVELWSADRLWDEGVATLGKWNVEKEGHRAEIAAFQSRLLREKGDYAGVVKIVDALVKVNYKAERDKTQAQETRLAEILKNDLDQDDFEQAMRNLRANADVYRNCKTSALNIVSDPRCTKTVRKMAATRLDWAKVVEICEMNMTFDFQWGWNWTNRDFFVGYFDALRHVGRGKEIPCVVDKILASPKVKEAQDRAEFQILADYFRTGKVNKTAVCKAVEPLQPAQKLRTLAQAAKFFVADGDRKTALEIYAIRQSLMFTRPQNRAKVAYVKDAPVDVGGWFASGLVNRLEKHVVDVPFDSDEAKKLILDVSVQRVVEKTGGEAETYFYVCWDETGVHLLFVGMDPEWRKVLEGAVSGTGYEMYLRFGEGAPTYQWLLDDQVKGKVKFLDYASQGKAYRPLKDHLVMYHAPIDGGLATVMNISWTACYERLPKDGTTWPFEIIHWSRGGGVTWGGETIWETSRWGRWVFEGLTEERLTAIKRSLLNGAVARFKAQERIGAGEITTWKDREIGDPEFYEQALKPLVDKLLVDAKLLTPDADAKTIERLYAEDMGPMYDFKYFSDEIRERYLRNRLTE